MEVIEFFTFKFFNKIGRNKTSSTIKEFTIKETIFVNITPNQNKVSSIDLEIKYKLLYEIQSFSAHWVMSWNLTEKNHPQIQNMGFGS